MTTDSPLPGLAALLATVLQDARAGVGTLVTGAPGSGRSRLLAQAAERLGPAGPLLTATASAATVPFGVLLGLLDADTAHRVASADGIGRAAMLRLALLGRDLDALVLDEVSLLDPGSAEVLLELARNGVVVVAALTDGRRLPRAVQELEAAGLVRRAALPPLEPADCAAIAAEAAGRRVDSGALEQLMRHADGDASLLRAVVEEAAASGALVRSGGVMVLAGRLPAPRSLQRAAALRFAELDEQERPWVVAVSIAEALAEDVAAALGGPVVTPRTAGWTVLDTITRTHRMRQRALAAAAVATTGVRARRAALKRLVAAHAAIARPLSAVERAALGGWRLELGEALDPAEALRLGLLTSLSSPDASERFLRAAVDAGGGPEAEVALAEQLKRTGRIGEAGALLGAAQPEDAQAADRIGAMLAIVTGIAARRSTGALAVLDARLARGAGGPESQAVRIALLTRERRPAEALELARAVGTPRTDGFASVFAGINEALLLTALGRPGSALRIVDELRGPAVRTVDRIPEGPVTLDWLSGWAPGVASLDIAVAEPIAVRNHRRMVETGMHAARVQFAHLAAMCRILAGDPDTAVRLLVEAEASPGIWRDSWLPRIVGSLAEAQALAGDLDAADASIARLRAMPRTPDHEGALGLAVAQLAAARGDAGAAVAAARGVASRAAADGLVVEAFDGFAAALRHGDDAAAADLLALGAAPSGHVRELQRAHGRAVLAGDVAEIGAIAGRLWAQGQRLLATSAAADAVRRGGDPERLARWAPQVPGLAGARAVQAAGAPLTEREREIAALVAAGHSDRDVALRLGISVRTAQTHLARAYAKLGVHRRMDLAERLPAG